MLSATKQNLLIVLTVILIVFILAFPNETAYNAKYALSLCTNAIIPSLFMFIVLSRILAHLLKCRHYSFGLSKKISEFLGIEPILLPICLLGLFCGAPSACIAICEIYKSSLCSKESAERAVILSNNCSLAFILSIVSATLQSKPLSVIIAICNILATIIVYMVFYRKRCVFRKTDYYRQPSKNLSYIITDSITEGFRSTLVLSGYVLFFYTFSCLVSERIYLALCTVSKEGALLAKAATHALFELTSGVIAAGSTEGNIRIMLICAAVSFCSVSVLMQVASAAQSAGIPVKKFFLSKCLTALICPILTLIILFIIPREVNVMNTYPASAGGGFSSQDLICLVFVTCVVFLAAHILSALDKKHKN